VFLQYALEKESRFSCSRDTTCQFIIKKEFWANNIFYIATSTYKEDHQMIKKIILPKLQ